MARRITESIMNAISAEELKESIGTRTDVENINQKENDEKVVKLAKHLVKGEKISEDDFRLLRDKLTTPTYKMVDKGETYTLQRGEEVIYSWNKDSIVEEEPEPVKESEEKKCCECNNGLKEDGKKCDCPCHKEGKEMLPDSDNVEENADMTDIAKKMTDETMKTVKSTTASKTPDVDKSDLEEGHTDDIIAEVLELAKEQGKNWNEEALRKLTVPQLHVIKAKLINPDYKTRKELAAEEEKKAKKAELVKTESDGSITYKVRVGKTETILEAATDEEAIDAFDKLYPDNKEVELKDTGVTGLQSANTGNFKVYVKETLEGKYAYIIRDRATSKTVASGEGNSEEEIIEKVNEELERLDNEE